MASNVDRLTALVNNVVSPAIYGILNTALVSQPYDIRIAGDLGVRSTKLVPGVMYQLDTLLPRTYLLDSHITSMVFNNNLIIGASKAELIAQGFVEAGSGGGTTTPNPSAPYPSVPNANNTFTKEIFLKKVAGKDTVDVHALDESGANVMSSLKYNFPLGKWQWVDGIGDTHDLITTVQPVEFVQAAPATEWVITTVGEGVKVMSYVFYDDLGNEIIPDNIIIYEDLQVAVNWPGAVSGVGMIILDNPTALPV